MTRRKRYVYTPLERLKGNAGYDRIFPKHKIQVELMQGFGIYVCGMGGGYAAKLAALDAEYAYFEKAYTSSMVKLRMPLSDWNRLQEKQ